MLLNVIFPCPGNFGAFSLMRSWKLNYFLNTILSVTLCKIVTFNAFLIYLRNGLINLMTYSPVKLWFSIKLIATQFFSTPFNC